jgi:hypothetical protein
MRCVCARAHESALRKTPRANPLHTILGEGALAGDASARRADLNADGKVDGWVKLGADYLCQILRKRRPVLAVKEVIRVFVIDVAIRHHPNNMVRAAAGSEPELLSLGLHETRRGRRDNSICMYARTEYTYPQ